MAMIHIPGVWAQPNKDGTMRYYRRVIRRVGGKQKPEYIRLPDLASPNFHAELMKINSAVKTKAPAAKRHLPSAGTIAALIREFRVTLPHREGQKGQKLSQSSLDNWETYLKQIEADHGHKVVADLRKSHLLKIRDGMMDTPGKCNAYMSRLKVLLTYAHDRDWIVGNPATEIDRMKTGEHAAWPGDVVTEVYEMADPMLRLAIVSGLCSGLRISDLIRMREDWIKPGPLMQMPPSKKTNTEAFVPMHARWLEEIAAMKALYADKPVQPSTLLHLQNGKPFQSPSELQKALKEIMWKLGHVERDDKGRPVDKDGNLVTAEAGNNPKIKYHFHGLSKNAICYLAELDLDDNTIGAIVGKTAATVRHYTKQKRQWMIAKNAADKVVRGRFDKLVAGEITMAAQQ